MSIERADFGWGVLSQGHIVTDMETDRLLAKKAWLYLYDYFKRHSERIKQSRIPIPWSLENDPDLVELAKYAQQQLVCFTRPELIKRWIEISEYATEDVDAQATFFRGEIRTNERAKWVLDRVTANNPGTVLEVGAGVGVLAVEIARMGIQVTCIAPSETHVTYAKSLQEEENLPIEWVHDIFEVLDFGESKFDVVLACEVLEHVQDDLSFLQKCVDLSKRATLVTVPYGSVLGGFSGHLREKWDTHIRAYSETSLKSVISRIRGASMKQFEVRKSLRNGSAGQESRTGICYCVNLKKEEVSDGDQNVTPEGAHGEIREDAPV